MKTVIILISLILFTSCTQQKILSNNNSLDADLDGVHDYRDNCPDEPGSIFNFGCPNAEPKLSSIYDKNKSTDADLDGIPDSKDDCPALYGSPFNQGCPFHTNPL